MIHILIADDHPIVRKGLIQILLEEFPTALIGEASDTEELIQKIILEPWNIVICDLNMPGRSGIEAIYEIRKLSSALPVLIMSMFPEEQYALRALRAGASGFLAKESVHCNLIKAIQTVLLGRKYISPVVGEKLAEALETNSTKQGHDRLSRREFEVFELITNGKGINDIAGRLSLSPSTVSTHRSRILEKMNMSSNAELIRYAADQKLF